MRPTHIVIHHNGVPGRTIDDVRNWHVNGLGWGDVGYHYVIHEDGTLHYGRHPSHRGAHARGGPNECSIGVCLIGNGNDRPFEAIQMSELTLLCHALCQVFEIPPFNVIGHREVDEHFTNAYTQKLCPGKHFDCAAFRGSLVA